MKYRVAALALCCAFAAVAIPSHAATTHLRPGDKLSYDISIQLVERTASWKGASRQESTVDSSTGTGTETLDVIAVDGDGSAHGSLTIDMLGYAHGQPVVFRKTVDATITPAGEIKPASSIDPLLDQTITMANQSVRDLATRNLKASQPWRWEMRADDYPMTLAFARQSLGQQQYQGLPTFVIQTAGGGNYGADKVPVKASVGLVGTYYYDQRDGLFIGQATRTDTVVSETPTDSVDSSALVTIVLRKFERAPLPEASPAPSPEPTVEASATPAPTPSGLAPEPAPTVTPRS